MQSARSNQRNFSVFLHRISDVFREQKSGSGSGSLFRGRSGSGINILGTLPMYFRVLLLKSKVGVDLGSVFWGCVWVGVLKFGVVPLEFWGFGSLNTSLHCMVPKSSTRDRYLRYLYNLIFFLVPKCPMALWDGPKSKISFLNLRWNLKYYYIG